MAKKFFGVQGLNVFNTAGTWTKTNASNTITLDKTAADDTTTLIVEIPKESGYLGFDKQPIKSVSVFYSVATAALDAAPSAVLNKIVAAAATGLTRSAVTETEAISGDNTTGTAAGEYKLTVTPSTTITPADDESYTLEVTFNAGATTVLKFLGMEVETT